MMITVAGRAMWKDYSKAVTLGMRLWTFQITLKVIRIKNKIKKSFTQKSIGVTLLTCVGQKYET